MIFKSSFDILCRSAIPALNKFIILMHVIIYGFQADIRSHALLSTYGTPIAFPYDKIKQDKKPPMNRKRRSPAPRGRAQHERGELSPLLPFPTPLILKDFLQTFLAKVPISNMEDSTVS